jgi:hypothetical protein
MSIEERLRTGLAADTRHLSPRLELELARTLRRAQRRRRARVTCAAVLVAGIVTAVAWGGGVKDLDRADEPPAPAQVPDSQPTDLVGVEGKLEPGTYSMAVWGDTEANALPRAIVEVPAGYFSNGGWAIDAGHDTLDPDQYGEVLVWRVDTIIPDPCDATKGAPLGPTVNDLARALRTQPGHTTTPPRPVTIDGHRGLHLTLTTPPEADFSTCTNGTHALWNTRPEFTYDVEDPGLTNDFWILDVDGTRLVIAAINYPDQTRRQHDALIDIARTIRFDEPQREQG